MAEYIERTEELVLAMNAGARACINPATANVPAVCGGGMGGVRNGKAD